MLKVLVPATSKQLTTLEMAYDFLGISSDAGADAQLNFLIGVASDIIAGYCGREFALQKYEEKLPGYGTNKLLLSVTPIKNIESVTVDGLPVDDYEAADNLYEYVAKHCYGENCYSVLSYFCPWHPARGACSK